MAVLGLGPPALMMTKRFRSILAKNAVNARVSRRTGRLDFLIEPHKHYEDIFKFFICFFFFFLFTFNNMASLGFHAPTARIWRCLLDEPKSVYENKTAFT